MYRLLENLDLRTGPSVCARMHYFRSRALAPAPAPWGHTAAKKQVREEKSGSGIWRGDNGREKGVFFPNTQLDQLSQSNTPESIKPSTMLIQRTSTVKYTMLTVCFSKTRCVSDDCVCYLQGLQSMEALESSTGNRL